MNEEIVELTITDLSRGGAGVAREPSGRVIFVPKTAPGALPQAEAAPVQSSRGGTGSVPARRG